MADTAAIENTQVVEEPEQSSRFMRILRGGSWTFTGIFFLLLFTVFKLPDDRIGPWIDGKIQEILRPMGINYSAVRSQLKFGLGVSYVLENVTVNVPPDGHYYFDKMSVSPSFIALLTLKAGADVRLESGKGRADLTAKVGKGSQSVSFSLKDVDVGKFGSAPGDSAPAPANMYNLNPMAILGGIKKTGFVNGTGSFSGDFAVPNTLDGKLAVNLSKVVLEQQSVMGFALPRIGISEGKVEVAVEKGKLALKNVKVGKSGDDLRATATGDLVLGKSWDSSLLNVKVNFSLSETVMKALVLVDALLAPGKQGDGSYTYAFSGPLANPVPTPGGSK